MSVFEQAFGVVIGNEGGYTNDPADPGNWTGGAIGVGMCRGTKWGISAAGYPTLDIRDVTVDDARAIYLQRYWGPICGEQLAPALALLVFDAAVNNGPGRAIRLLQAAVGAEEDGLLGPRTLAAVRASDTLAVCGEFQARRLMFMVGLPTWRSFGLGWARRFCGLPFRAQAVGIGSAAAPSPGG